MKWKIALLLSATLLIGCVETGSVNCAGWKPLRLDAQSIDGLTERDAADILAHNEFWRAQCSD